MAQAAAEVAGDADIADQLRALVERLREPFALSPFGDPEMLSAQREPILALCGALERRLADREPSVDISADKEREFARRALRAIAKQATTDSHDYDTARQLCGAWIVVYEELSATGSLPLAAASQLELNRILDQLIQRDPFLLDRQRVTVPCGPDGTKLVANELPPKLDSDAALLKLYRARAQYDPAWFAGRMDRLARLTGE
jgi:hypothetical protein